MINFRHWANAKNKVFFQVTSGRLYIYRVAKFSPKVCSRLTTKVADLGVPARFLVILFLMQFVPKVLFSFAVVSTVGKGNVVA